MNIQNKGLKPLDPDMIFQTDEEIGKAQTRVIEHMRSNPERSPSSVSTRGRISEGLACTVVQGDYTAVTDLGPAMGGNAAGPSPSFFARTAIVGCVGIAVKMTAAREGLKFKSVEVEVTTDMDGAALMGVSGNSAAPLETRVDIHVETDEPAETVEALIGDVLKRDPWFLALRDAQVVLPKVILHRPE